MCIEVMKEKVGDVLSVCSHRCPFVFPMSNSDGGEISRSSLGAGKWADLYFGSFPVKFPGD